MERHGSCGGNPGMYCRSAWLAAEKPAPMPNNFAARIITECSPALAGRHWPTALAVRDGHRPRKTVGAAAIGLGVHHALSTDD
jgi:hypothetical protein